MPTIPTFPVFRRLEISDRAAIEAITTRFPPYSDFGFTSLWSWDTDETCAISILGGNLVVRFKDFMSDAHFYSFIGQDAVIETVELLLAHARQEGQPAQLKLVPEAVIAADDRLPQLFSVVADRDNFDYIYSVDDWARFPAPHFHDHREKAERCHRRAELEFRLLDQADPNFQTVINELFFQWMQQKQTCSGANHCHEWTALQRLYALTENHGIAAGGCYQDEHLVGFSIWEALSGSEYVVGHFQKTDRAHRGLSSWLAQALGRHLLHEGRRLINGEQDLGIVGLREYKRSLRPRRFLRKYIIAGRGA